MTTAKPLRADARRNREALLAKAREVFAAGGFDLRFDDFARLAGVGTGTLYRHLPTRDALADLAPSEAYPPSESPVDHAAEVADEPHLPTTEELYGFARTNSGLCFGKV